MIGNSRQNTGMVPVLHFGASCQCMCMCVSVSVRARVCVSGT